MRNRRVGWLMVVLTACALLHVGVSGPASAQQAEAKPAVQIKPAQIQIRAGNFAQPAVPVPGTATKEGEGANPTDRVKLPQDRNTNKKINEARRLVEVEQDYGQAVRLLQNILDSKEDVFQRDETSGRWASVRAEANRILGSMPREGLQFYELQYGGQAKSLLKQAAATGDPQIYADVAQRFMHTEAGAEAAALLGTYHLDHGRYIVAALCFERLFQRDGMLNKQPPVTLYKAALAFERAGDTRNLARVWTELERKLNDPNEKPLPPALRRMDAAALKSALAQKGNAVARDRFDWPLFQGAPDRTAHSEGGSPFLEYRYKLDTIKTPEFKEFMETIARNRTGRNYSMLAGFHPIAVGGKLIYRSYWGVHAIDIKTGATEWEAKSQATIDNLIKERTTLDPTNQINNAIQTYAHNAASAPLLYDNSVLGTLSADAGHVYAIEDLAVPPMTRFDEFRPFPRAGPNLGGFVDRWQQNSSLIAYELDTGRIAWVIGTNEADQPFSDTFFLGPPLPLGDKLYVLAEVNSEIRLLCLQTYMQQGNDNKPHEKVNLAWSQTLCLVERKIADDPTRRTQAAHLTYGDGMLICPTNAGVVLGLDLLTKSLVWAHSYQEQAEQPDYMRHGGQAFINGRVRMVGPGGMPMSSDAALKESLVSWTSSAPVIRDGKVVFTAPDADSVHCLNLRDGAPLWKQPRNNDLYMAGVYNGKVLLVGKDTCRALALNDGSPAWKTETGLPSGRGVASSNTYFLPLRNAEVWALNIDKGTIDGKSRSPKNEVPGNLIFHDGDVLSQTTTAVLAYPQLAIKEREINVRLEKNPKDPTGLTERGELRLHRGELTGAVQDLRTALAQDLANELRVKARLKLYEALGDLLQKDFVANEKHLKEFEELSVIPVLPSEPEEMRHRREEEMRDRRGKILCLVAKGREEQGKFQEALAAYVELAELGRKEMLTMPEDPSTRALPEVWVQGRIAAMIDKAKANPDQKKTLDAAMDAQWQQVQSAANVDALERFVSLFGPLCEQGQKAQLQFAEKLMDNKQFSAAQIKMLALSRQAEPTIAAQALDGLARISTRLGDLENAAWHYRNLADKYPTVIVRDGKTGREIYLDLATDKRFLPYLDEPRRGWLGAGQGEMSKPEQVTGTFAQQQQMFWLEPEGEATPLCQRFRLGIDVNAGNGRVKLVDRITGDERHAFALVGDRPQVYPGQQKYQPTYRMNGQIMVFHWGANVYAFDPVNKRELWRYNLLGQASPSLSALGGQMLLNQNGQLEVWYPDGFRERVGTIAAVEPNCVCFLVKDEGLVAVDPITGQKRWVKSDVPINTEFFSDAHHLYMVPAGKTGGVAQKGIALRTIDGLPVTVPEFASLYQRKQAVFGRNLLIRDIEPQGAVTLRLYDAHTGKDRWKKSFPGEKAITLNSLEPGLIGMVESSGKTTVLQAETGAVVLNATLDPTHLTNSPEIKLLRDGSHVYLLFNGAAEVNPQAGVNRRTIQPYGLQIRSEMVNGPVYAFDRVTGKEKWRKTVPYQAVIVDQFDDLPMLLFASMQAVWVGANNPQVPPLQKNVNAVLALDKRDGREICNEEYQSTSVPYHSLRIDPRMNTVELISFRQKITFRLMGVASAALPAGRVAAAPTELGPRQQQALEIEMLRQEIMLRNVLEQQRAMEAARALQQAQQLQKQAKFQLPPPPAAIPLPVKPAEKP